MKKFRVKAETEFFVWANSKKQAMEWFRACMEEVEQAMDEANPDEPCFSRRTAISWENLVAEPIEPEDGEEYPGEDCEEE